MPFVAIYSPWAWGFGPTSTWVSMCVPYDPYLTCFVRCRRNLLHPAKALIDQAWFGLGDFTQPFPPAVDIWRWAGWQPFGREPWGTKLYLCETGGKGGASRAFEALHLPACCRNVCTGISYMRRYQDVAHHQVLSRTLFPCAFSHCASSTSSQEHACRFNFRRNSAQEFRSTCHWTLTLSYISIGRWGSAVLEFSLLATRLIWCKPAATCSDRPWVIAIGISGSIDTSRLFAGQDSHRPDIREVPASRGF